MTTWTRLRLLAAGSLHMMGVALLGSFGDAVSKDSTDSFFRLLAPSSVGVILAYFLPRLLSGRGKESSYVLYASSFSLAGIYALKALWVPHEVLDRIALAVTRLISVLVSGTYWSFVKTFDDMNTVSSSGKLAAACSIGQMISSGLLFSFLVDEKYTLMVYALACLVVTGALLGDLGTDRAISRHGKHRPERSSTSFVSHLGMREWVIALHTFVYCFCGSLLTLCKISTAQEYGASTRQFLQLTSLQSLLLSLFQIMCQVSFIGSLHRTFGSGACLALAPLSTTIILGAYHVFHWHDGTSQLLWLLGIAELVKKFFHYSVAKPVKETAFMKVDHNFRSSFRIALDSGVHNVSQLLAASYYDVIGARISDGDRLGVMDPVIHIVIWSLVWILASALLSRFVPNERRVKVE